MYEDEMNAVSLKIDERAQGWAVANSVHFHFLRNRTARCAWILASRPQSK